MVNKKNRKGYEYIILYYIMRIGGSLLCGRTGCGVLHRTMVGEQEEEEGIYSLRNQGIEEGGMSYQSLC